MQRIRFKPDKERSPTATVSTEIPADLMVMADSDYLSWAMGNVVRNGFATRVTLVRS